MKSQVPKSKVISDQKEFLSLLTLVKTFPKIHNSLKEDFHLLISITESRIDQSNEFHTLCRACIKNLFSIIEADIFYYNLFDKYAEYDDLDTFIDKFKKTFKQICKTWDREPLRKKYFDTQIHQLLELRGLRNRLLHPKEIIDLFDPAESDFIKVKDAFQAYDEFITSIMSNFFIEGQLTYEQLIRFGLPFPNGPA
jgi:hypothetical protein